MLAGIYGFVINSRDVNFFIISTEGMKIDEFFFI